MLIVLTQTKHLKLNNYLLAIGDRAALTAGDFGKNVEHV